MTRILILALALSGCAKHADFVEVREDLRTVTRAQEQTQKRLQALESKGGAVAGDAGKDSAALRQQLDDLTARLKQLEGRLARMEEGQPVAPAKPEAAVEPSRQSKPAMLPPRPESPAALPGTPDISPTSAYNLAYNDYLNGRYDLAVSGFQRFLQDFPSTSLVPNAHYWLGESYYGLKDHVRAMQSFEKVVTEHPISEKVAPALYKLGLAAAETGNAAKAREYLKRVLQDYKDSNEAKLAKGKLAELR
jgi:tol-pal system protein YbgF